VASAGPTASECPVGEPALDQESAAWVRGLGGSGQAYDQTVTRLHELLLRVARSEIRRRGGQLAITGPELDDLAHQAAADAVIGVMGKVAQFRGESRFTTWACKFAIFEVSTKIGRHFWQKPAAPMDAEDWDRVGAETIHRLRAAL
jgi:RNA polymerase sigma-70 factor, ECF subfamily